MKKIVRQLAYYAVLDALIGGCEPKNTEAQDGTLIQLYGESLTTWHGIEGVELKRRKKPVQVHEVHEKYEVKKMFVMADKSVINDDFHCFTNQIILN